MELIDDILKRRSEITNEAAADAAGIHLRDLDACFLQESAVDTDLTELVLDEHDLLSVISVRDELLDKSSLTGTQESGENVYLCHSNYLLSIS